MSFEKDSQCSVFISSEHDYSRDNKEEREANEFAEDMLIPKETWKKMMSTGTKNLSNQHNNLKETISCLTTGYRWHSRRYLQDAIFSHLHVCIGLYLLHSS